MTWWMKTGSYKAADIGVRCRHRFDDTSIQSMMLVFGSEGGCWDRQAFVIDLDYVFVPSIEKRI